MLRVVVRRLLAALPITLAVATLVFSLIHLIPGDPVLVLLGEGAQPTDVEALRHRMGLDRPLGEQYLGFLGGLARHGEDRPLDRLDHAAVGRVGALAQAAHQRVGGEHVVVAHAVGETLPELREDGARVPARPHHCAVRDVRRNRADVPGRVAAGLLDRVAHGHQHIGAGVAVGHGEDVELIHRGVMLIQPVGGGFDHGLEHIAVAGRVVEDWERRGLVCHDGTGALIHCG
jgi:hypothetical protein